MHLGAAVPWYCEWHLLKVESSSLTYFFSRVMVSAKASFKLFSWMAEPRLFYQYEALQVHSFSALSGSGVGNDRTNCGKSKLSTSFAAIRWSLCENLRGDACLLYRQRWVGCSSAWLVCSIMSDDDWVYYIHLCLYTIYIIFSYCEWRRSWWWTAGGKHCTGLETVQEVAWEYTWTTCWTGWRTQRLCV